MHVLMVQGRASVPGTKDEQKEAHFIIRKTSVYSYKFVFSIYYFFNLKFHVGLFCLLFFHNCQKEYTRFLLISWIQCIVYICRIL